MGRLIKAELIKLRKSRTFLVCSIIALVLGAGMTILYYIAWLSIGETLDMTREYLLNFGLPEETVIDTLSVVPRNNAWSYINTCLADTNVVYLLSIVVCILAASEYNMGTYKLSVARGYSRLQVFFSKLIIAVFASLIIVAVYVLGGALTSVIMFGFSSDTQAGMILLHIGAYLALYIAAASVFMMISVLTKKTGAAIAVSIIVPIIIESGITIIMIGLKDFSSISRYWIFNTLTATQSLIKDGQWYIPFIVAAGYLLISTLIGAFIFRKQEIK